MQRVVCFPYWWVLIFISISSSGEAVSWLTHKATVFCAFWTRWSNQSDFNSTSRLGMTNFQPIIRGICFMVLFSLYELICFSLPCNLGLWAFPCHYSWLALVLEKPLVYFANMLNVWTLLFYSLLMPYWALILCLLYSLHITTYPYLYLLWNLSIYTRYL